MPHGLLTLVSSLPRDADTSALALTPLPCPAGDCEECFAGGISKRAAVRLPADVLLCARCAMPALQRLGIL